MKKHQCMQCSKLFHDKIVLKYHLQAHSEEKPFPCSHPGCTYHARTKGDVRKHEKTHLKLRPFPCNYPGCSYHAAEEKIRNQHEATHDPFRAKIFQCPLCPRGFSRRSDLNAHIKRHVNERPHQCQQCKYATFTPKQLNVHVQRVHQSPKKRRSGSKGSKKSTQIEFSERKEKRFKCIYCNFSSDVTRGLGTHLAFKHPEKQEIIS